MRFALPRSKSRRALLISMPVLALAATALTLSTQAGAAQQDAVRAKIGADEFYINYVEPRVQPDRDAKEVKNAKGIFVSPVDEAQAYDHKFATGNPVTAKVLSKLEGQSIKTGKSPRQIKQAKSTQVAKLLTVLVEFSDTANDDFTGAMVPSTVFESRECVPGTIQNGPLHNQIPNPAALAHEDNNTMWVPDFSSEHFNKMLYTNEGITERVRTDLTGPDGQPGISMAGYTMRNMYLEMSKGAYTVDGQATPWVKVPHSEAWYGASRCFQNEEGEWVAGAMQSMNGHPNNPGGPGALAIDAVNTLVASDPNFPWADYDIEDQADRDGDGNFYEPDGVIDHLVLVHAGEDKSGGGGAQGIYSIWAHSSSVSGGYTIPGTEIQVSNYIVQPEDSGVGVFAHEYGHDLGLPDLYDTSGNADSDVDFWDLMSSGSHSGPIFQSMPTHMGIWDKWVLGWADPLIMSPGKSERDVQLGQTSRTPRGTKDGIKIDLPNKVVTLAEPHSGANMWYTGSDQSLADVKVAREIQVPNAADAKFWMWNNYVIEEAWDFGFVEVSTDGGASWTESKVFDAAGNLVTTDDGYQDPNNTIAVLFGGKKYGITGDSHGWRHDYIDLSAYAGQTVQVRLRMATDWAFQERGWFADDFSVSGGGTDTPVDDVESGTNGWTATGGTWEASSGPGWHIDTGTMVQAHYYLAEWRNFDGFDEGLKYTYDTTYSRDAWKVEKVKYNAPGMLVWYRDTALGGVNHVTANSTVLPSYGSKGGLLIVDSHFDPLRRSGDAAALDPTTLKNIPSRPQSSNAAFSLNPTYPFQECLEAADEPYSEYCTSFPAQPAVSTFTDAKGWYPGLELRGSSLFARDVDASVVVPSVGNAPYTTRIVDPAGNLIPDLYGFDLGFTVLGTGNPGDAGVAYGVTISIVKHGKDNTYATVHVVPVAAP